MVESLLPLMGMNTLDEVLDSMSEQMQDAVDVQAFLLPAITGYKVTHQHMARLAEAAELFYKAKPWVSVDSLHMIRIDSPRAPRRLKYAMIILDENDEPGLALFSSRKQYQSYFLYEDIDTWGTTGDCWQMTFEPQDCMPPGDVTAWQLYGWPLPHLNAYPFVIKLDNTGSCTRPPESILVYLEGLLRVLAEVDISKLKEASQTIKASTFTGSMDYKLSLIDQSHELNQLDTSKDVLRLADYLSGD